MNTSWVYKTHQYKYCVVKVKCQSFGLRSFTLLQSVEGFTQCHFKLKCLKGRTFTYHSYTSTSMPKVYLVPKNVWIYNKLLFRHWLILHVLRIHLNNCMRNDFMKSYYLFFLMSVILDALIRSTSASDKVE